MRHPQNWLQLLRFGAVGASGYVVNLAVFATCVHLIGVDYRVSSVIAYLVSVTSNFWLNRHWTFSAKAAHPMGRIAEPSEVANAALWLCSEQASFVTGHQLAIDGGLTAI